MTLLSLNAKPEPEWVQSESGLIIPSDCRPAPRLKAFDFFAGAGGMSCGFHQAGLHVVGAMEFDYGAAQTYMVNLARYGEVKIHFDTPEREAGFEKYLEKQFARTEKKRGLRAVDFLAGSGWIRDQEGPGCEHFWIADIRNITGDMILKELGMKRGELDVAAGGPPCQGFSRAGNQDIYDPRNVLVFEFARLIVELQPKTFVFENVPGILDMTTPEGVPIMDEFCSIIADGNYASYESVRKMLSLNPKARRVVRKTVDKKKAYGKSEKKKKKEKAKAVAAPAAQQSMF